jgi:beta-lactamase class D
VPAYQALARRIGKEKMEGWIRRLDYGDKNISAGLDVFWLPAEGRQTLLITPRRQAALLADWSAGRLPFDEATNRDFRAIFLAREDAGGKLFGKTGSGRGTNAKSKLGWFVGVFVSPRGKIALACALHGEAVSGRDARAVIEKIFPANPR